MKNQRIKNSLYSLAGTIFPKAINLISIPVLVRLMSTAEYGRINVFTTYVTIFSIFLGMDFAVAVGKGTLEYHDSRQEFLSVGIGSTFIFTCAVFGTMNIWNEFFCRLFHLNIWQLNVLIIYSYATFLISFKSMDLIYNMEYSKNFGLNAIVSIGGLLFSVACMRTVFSADRFMGRVIGTAAPAVLMGSFIFVQILHKGKKIFDKQIFKFYAHMGIPLIPHSISQFILSNADKIMIEEMISSSKSGVYSFITSLGLLMTAFTEAVNNLWNPWLFRRLDENNDTLIRKMFYPYILFFSAISVLVEGITPEIVKILGTADYYDGLKYCIWMTLTAYLLFLCNKYVDLQYYEKKTYFVSIGTFFAAIMNLLLNVLFLKPLGYEFAVVSTLISYTALVFLYMFVVNKILKKKLIDSLFVTGILIFMYSVTALLQYFYDSIFIRYGIAAGISVALVLAALFKTDKTILNTVKK